MIVFTPPTHSRVYQRGNLFMLGKFVQMIGNTRNKKTLLVEKFVARRYKREELIRIRDEIGREDKEQFIQPKTRDRAKTFEEVAYISTYDVHAELVRKSITKAWHVLQKNPQYGKLFKEPPRFVYRKGKSLGNQLIKSDIREPKINLLSSTTKKGTYPCLGCSNYSSVIKGENIHHPTQGYKIPARGYYTCNSACVVYLLKCPCGRAYVGQTSRPIKKSP